jgi:hypothetical protein
MRISLLAALGLLAAVPAVQAQNWEAEPTYGSVELSEGFLPDPYEVSLTAGGSLVPAIEGCDFGNIAEAPDFDLYYETSGGATLYIYAVSGADATILVNTPDETWVCDDDSYGEGDPLVVIPEALGGLYDIWVGTYDGEPTEAILYISEVDPRASD